MEKGVNIRMKCILEVFDDAILEGSVTKKQMRKILKWWKVIEKDFDIKTTAFPNGSTFTTMRRKELPKCDSVTKKGI